MYFIGNSILPFLFLLHLTRANDPHEDIRSTCRNESGLTEDETREGFTNLVPKLGNYAKCCMLKCGFLGEDGGLNPEQLVIAVGKDLHDEAEPTIFECAEETKDIEEACEKILEFFGCFKEKNPETYAKIGVFGKPGPDRNY